MNRLPLRHTFTALFAAAVLAGCASKVPLSDSTASVPVETRTPGAAGGANSAGTSQSSVANVDLGRNAAGSNLPAAARTVYFDYDSFAVRDDARSIVENNARLLAGDRSRRAMVEGHTDDRGGREYNLALGQKRAEAVVRSLTLLGATAGQLEAVSYGKERPAVQGADEAAFAKNRRAEIVYR